MSIKKEPSGRRSISVEVEVPGTPEEVWEAIATGPGVSSWFVPTEVRDDGTVVAHFAPGMDSVAKVTAWDEPRRFAAESPDLGPNAPSLATEWIVEARSGGTCVVRVVHSLFAATDDWDDQLTGFESGWPGFFRILRLYLAHFRRQRCSRLQVMGSSAASEAEAWASLMGSLGFSGAAVNQRAGTIDGVPRLAGIVEEAGGPKSLLLLRVDDPAPGAALLAAFPMGGQTVLEVSLYLYGDDAAAAVARDEPLWQTWMTAHFPMAAGIGCG